MNRSLEKLKDEGYTVVGLAEEGPSTLSEVKFQGPLVVIVGSEDKGISLITRRLCDQLVRIPLMGVTKALMLQSQLLFSYMKWPDPNG